MACLSAELTRRMKQCPPQGRSDRQLPFTTHVCRRLVALSPGSADTAKPDPVSSGHFLRPLRIDCDTAGSTSTMGTSMVDEHPTLFRDSFLFGLLWTPSLTFLRL
jgi:hypothetical protein